MVSGAGHAIRSILQLAWLNQRANEQRVSHFSEEHLIHRYTNITKTITHINTQMAVVNVGGDIALLRQNDAAVSVDVEKATLCKGKPSRERGREPLLSHKVPGGCATVINMLTPLICELENGGDTETSVCNWVVIVME